MTGKERREKSLGKTMKEAYEGICDEYLRQFCEKHGWEAEYGWIGGEPGGTVEVCDMFVSLKEMRYDIDNNIPEDKFEEWYWKALEIYTLGCQQNLPFAGFCQGLPWPYTDEQLEAIRESQKRVL